MVAHGLANWINLVKTRSMGYAIEKFDRSGSWPRFEPNTNPNRGSKPSLIMLGKIFVAQDRFDDEKLSSTSLYSLHRKFVVVVV